MTITSLHQTNLGGVQVVLASGYVFKVSDAIIGFIAILVIDFLSWRARSKEGGGNQAMNIRAFVDSVSLETYPEVAIRIAPRLDDFSGPAPSRCAESLHGSVGRNCVVWILRNDHVQAPFAYGLGLARFAPR